MNLQWQITGVTSEGEYLPPHDGFVRHYRDIEPYYFNYRRAHPEAVRIVVDIAIPDTRMR